MLLIKFLCEKLLHCVILLPLRLSYTGNSRALRKKMLNLFSAVRVPYFWTKKNRFELNFFFCINLFSFFFGWDHMFSEWQICHILQQR